ncbi:MAG: hypothetical protein Q8R55_01885 [Candidatus Taylorbacteria bacterium]|nr:hypothetical protein [Candidatus Taylorbacteria bacterium]
MDIFTVPKKITKGDDLIIMSREEYERLITIRQIPEFKPTAKDREDLAQARKNLKAGKFLTIHELRKKLGPTG